MSTPSQGHREPMDLDYEEMRLVQAWREAPAHIRKAWEEHLRHCLRLPATGLRFSPRRPAPHEWAALMADEREWLGFPTEEAAAKACGLSLARYRKIESFFCKKPPTYYELGNLALAGFDVVRLLTGRSAAVADYQDEARLLVAWRGADSAQQAAAMASLSTGESQTE